MKRIIALLTLAVMGLACGGPTPEQLRTLAKAKVQDEGWRPLFVYDSDGYILIIACREEGEARGTVYGLLVNEKPEIVATDAVEDVTCEISPAVASR